MGAPPLGLDSPGFWDPLILLLGGCGVTDGPLALWFCTSHCLLLFGGLAPEGEPSGVDVSKRGGSLRPPLESMPCYQRMICGTLPT